MILYTNHNKENYFLKQTGGNGLERASFADIRMLALDLDGTLLTRDKRITERTGKTLKAAAKAGLFVVPVTGRPFAGLPKELMDIEGIRYVITSNGASTRDLAEGSLKRSAMLENQVAEQILQIPVSEGLLYSVFVDGMGYCDPDTFRRLTMLFQNTPLEEYVRNSRRSCEDIRELLSDPLPQVENIWIVGKDAAQRDAINAMVHARWDLRTVLTARRDLEIGAVAADKGLAMQDLAQSLGISQKEILAIGDNENDLGMFYHAGISVAMANAEDAIQKQADLTTASNEEDGAALVIEELLSLK